MQLELGLEQSFINKNKNQRNLRSYTNIFMKNVTKAKDFIY